MIRTLLAIPGAKQAIVITIALGIFVMTYSGSFLPEPVGSIVYDIQDLVLDKTDDLSNLISKRL